MIEKMEVAKGVKSILSLDDIVLAGCTNTTVNRSAAQVDITNQISLDWREFLSGIHDWSVNCGGTYVANEASMNKLEESFLGGTPINVIVLIGSNKFAGSAIITNFPVGATYNDSFKYNLTLVGTGPLEKL